MIPEFFTIGVYGFEEETFFSELTAASIDTLCDVRRRRAVRGRQYSFANSRRLQAKLAELGIRYVYAETLAPSRELRQRQQAADRAGRTAKRRRAALSREFVEAYREERLAAFDSTAFAAGLDGARRVALLCVEREPEACHRSLIAERLEEEFATEVRHLLPGGERR